MRISGSLNLLQPVTEEVAAATSSWWPPQLRCNDPCGNSAPEHSGKTWSSWERIRRDLSQARFAIGDVANHDGVRLVAIPGHGFKSKWHKNEQTRKTNKPIGSMYGIFTYIWVIYGVNVGKYSIHGASGKCFEWFIRKGCS